MVEIKRDGYGVWLCRGGRHLRIVWDPEGLWRQQCHALRQNLMQDLSAWPLLWRAYTWPRKSWTMEDVYPPVSTTQQKTRGTLCTWRITYCLQATVNTDLSCFQLTLPTILEDFQSTSICLAHLWMKIQNGSFITPELANWLGTFDTGRDPALANVHHHLGVCPPALGSQLSTPTHLTPSLQHFPLLLSCKVTKVLVHPHIIRETQVHTER